MAASQEYIDTLNNYITKDLDQSITDDLRPEYDENQIDVVLRQLNEDLFDSEGKVKWGYVLLKIGVIIGRIAYLILLKKIR